MGAPEISKNTQVYILSLQTRSKVKKATYKVIKRYRDDPDLQNAIDGIQKGLKCCGGYSYHDWEHNEHFNCSVKTVQACGVPFSCCREVSISALLSQIAV